MKIEVKMFKIILVTLVVTSQAIAADLKWAFSLNLDGSINPKETCRETLAQVIYNDKSEIKPTRIEDSNVFIYKGNVETYTIHAFATKEECETSLDVAKSPKKEKWFAVVYPNKKKLREHKILAETSTLNECLNIVNAKVPKNGSYECGKNCDTSTMPMICSETIGNEK